MGFVWNVGDRFSLDKFSCELLNQITEPEQIQLGFN